MRLCLSILGLRDQVLRSFGCCEVLVLVRKIRQDCFEGHSLQNSVFNEVSTQVVLRSILLSDVCCVNYADSSVLTLRENFNVTEIRTPWQLKQWIEIVDAFRTRPAQKR